MTTGDILEFVAATVVLIGTVSLVYLGLASINVVFGLFWTIVFAAIYLLSLGWLLS